MIRNEIEYQEALRRLLEGKTHLKAQQVEMEKLGLSKADVRRAVAPLRSFQNQLSEEVESYERLRRGDRKELATYRNLGQLLIALRIASGVSQRQLAERLGVHESQVSRDERNDYHGVTVERANRVIEALGFELHCNVVPSTGLRAPRGRTVEVV